jgi:1-aminocyclopropane-1-carboxylate deaminase/D-cysteine desulfhydrase-like pyridoxal-dependent ACC family enzyme
MLRRRRSRAEQVVAEVKKTPAVVLIAAGAVLAGGLVALAYVGRRRLWKAVAVAADAVEEVADTVEDAAEDLAEAAAARAKTDAAE